MPHISSRTPEGIPGRCPICQNEVSVTPSDQFADAPCPACGVLLWPLPRPDGPPHLLFADMLSVSQRRALAYIAEMIEAGSADSLAHVEFIMELEDAFDTSIPDSVAENIRSLDDFLDWYYRDQGRDAA